MIYPNNNIENIFKAVHKTKDPKVLEWVIDNLDNFDYDGRKVYVDGDEKCYYHYDCTFFNLINFLIQKTNVTREQKEYLHLLRKGKSFVANCNIADYKNKTRYMMNDNFYFLRWTTISKKSKFDFLRNPFEEPSWYKDTL